MKACGVSWTARRALGAVAALALLTMLSGRTTAVEPRFRGAMRVALDPETGELGMPAPGDLQRFDGRQEPRAAPRIETLPDGMMILHHEGHFRNYSLVQRLPGGGVVTGCAAGADAARRALAAPPANGVPRDATGREVR